MVKIYFDNDVASAISKRDLNEEELNAIDQLFNWMRSGKIVIGTSRQSLREMSRAPSQYQAELKTGISGLEVAENDHKVLGFHMQTNQRGGCISNPFVTDVIDKKLYSALLNEGLKTDDARHLMYAVHNGYKRFLTCDNGILSRRINLEKLYSSTQIQKPSELVTKMSEDHGQT